MCICLVLVACNKIRKKLFNGVCLSWMQISTRVLQFVNFFATYEHQTVYVRISCLIFVHNLVLESNFKNDNFPNHGSVPFFFEVAKLVNCMYRTDTKVHVYSLSLKHYHDPKWNWH